MVYKEITGSVFKDMVTGAVSLLENNKQGLNDLNVFPVPDGDTGTNMSMTMMSSLAEVNASDAGSITSVADAVALGALKGARGNSGVILSQILRGFARGFEGDVKVMEKDHLIKAFVEASEAAYKAVMKPKEGTILTIIRSMSEHVQTRVEDEVDVYGLLVETIVAGERMLKKTPDMLPVLKEAGVVDAGGEGLLVLFRGMQAVLDGEEIDDIELDMGEVNVEFVDVHDTNVDDIEFGYCTEFFVRNLFDFVGENETDGLREQLMELGDCVLVIGDLGMIKVHVHTNSPGQALEYGAKLGELSKIKIDNMREEASAKHASSDRPKEKKPIGLVAVASGTGMGDIFRDFLVDEVIQGGQTMNPSAKTIADSIEQCPSDNVIVFPNNKNIIMAAEQAMNLSDKNVYVVPSKTLPQGIASVLAYNPEMDIDYNIKRMTSALSDVKTGQVTYAVRDAKANGHKIKEGEVMGISDGEIVCHKEDAKMAAMSLLENMVDEDEDAVITIFYGEDVDEEQASELAEMVEEKYDDFDVELHNGGQPVYSYIFSVE